MKKCLLILFFLLISVNLSYSRHHRHYRTHNEFIYPFRNEAISNIEFCKIIENNFYSLDVKGLDDFVKNISANKRKAALICIENIQKNKILSNE